MNDLTAHNIVFPTGAPAIKTQQPTLADPLPTAGVKFDAGKAPMDLLPMEALVATAEVLGFGALKYDRGNWAKGIEYSRLTSAALRHIFAFLAGEDRDKESGLSHIAHALCCLMFLSWMIQRRPDRDDRWTKITPGVAPTE